MESVDNSDAFVELVLSSQRRLYAYILALLPHGDIAHDVLQQTNMAMWTEADSFTQGTDFTAWSYRIAYLRVLEYREKRLRDRLRFDSELVETLAKESEAYTADEKGQLEAMQTCIKLLPERQRELLQRRYVKGERVSAIAATMKLSASALSSRLCRVRARLWECIQRRISAEARS